VADNWWLKGSYSFLDVQIHEGADSAIEGNSPENQFQIRSELNITDDLEFNSALYYVDTLPAQRAEEYLRLDMGLTWRPSPNVEFAVWGRNLLDPQHMEFDTESFLDSPSEVERSVYMQASFRF
jgi:outer membrane receptor for monomeric catechols